MDRFLAKANIEHFKKLLASETDAHKRLVLDNPLAEERFKTCCRAQASEREQRRLIKRPFTRASGSTTIIYKR
jgi:hypothetical protein